MVSAGNEAIIISVIMPVRNEARYIGQVLGDLAEQSFAREHMEVLVVDGDSNDNTAAEVERFRSMFPHFEILSNPGRLASHARNIGVRNARGTYIVFIDGHCHIRSQTMLADMLELFKRTGAYVLCRPQPLTMSPQTPFQRAVALARASRLGHALDSTIYSHRERPVRAASSGAMYKREVFDQIGYFDESFDACEDVELNTRADKAGLKAYLSPKLAVEYVARENIAALFKQLYRYGLGRWHLFRKHPGTLGAGALVTAAFAIGVLFYPLTWFLAKGFWIFATTVAGLYLLVLLLVSLANIKQVTQSWLFVFLPAIFFVIHFALGYGFLSGVVRSRT